MKRTTTASVAPTTTWYVKPKDSHTNHCIMDGAFPDVIHEKKMLIEGEEEPVKVLEVNHDTLRYFERSRIDLNLDFDVFCRTGDGPLRPSPFRNGKIIRSRTNIKRRKK